MADSTLDSELFFLIDKWPGVPVPMSIPQDFPNGSACGHNAVAPLFDVGTKIQVLNQVGSTQLGTFGLSTFIYLKLEAQDATNVLAVKHMVAQHSDAGNGGAEIFDVTNEVATLLTTQKGPVAFALGAMTENYYGWFWCGGVCPESWLSTLGGNYYTTNAVAIGDLTWGNLAPTAGTTSGEIGLDVANAVGETVIGIAMAADA